MQVKDAIAGILGRPSVSRPIPSAPRTVVAAAAIESSSLEIKAVKPFDLDEIAARLVAAFQTGSPPEHRDLKHAAWCIWQGDEPWSERPDVLTRFLVNLREAPRRSSFRRLASAYLIAFRPSALGGALSRVAETLADMAPDYAGKLLQASRELSLFEPERAPSAVAGLALSRGLSPAALLAQFGLRSLAAESGLAEAAFLAGLAQIRSNRDLSADARLDLIRTWGLRRNGELLFEQHRGALVDALVLPHADMNLPKETVDRFLDFLVRNFGDPRLRAARWQPMRSTETVRRWLTTLSLRQFLDVVDQGAYDYQWRFRRAFWEAVHRRGLIADAWVIFDEVGHSTARKLFEVKAPYARWSFSGRKQIQKGHAVLLLKIGRGIVAEWSHNGRCNIWHDAEDPDAPKLNRAQYNSDEVRISAEREQAMGRTQITHAGSESYSWQARVANEIFALTNVRVLEGEYRVAR